MWWNTHIRMFTGCVKFSFVLIPQFTLKVGSFSVGRAKAKHSFLQEEVMYSGAFVCFSVFLCDCKKTNEHIHMKFLCWWGLIKESY